MPPFPNSSARALDRDAPGGFVRSLRTAGSLLLRRVAAAIDRAAQRRALAMLDDRLLKDVGLTREEAAFEANKPFWLL